MAAAPGYKFETLIKGLIILKRDNYPSWRKLILNMAYFLGWHPAWSILTNGQGDHWDGQEEDDHEERKSRKEAFMALSATMPPSSEYHHLLSGIRRGDANAIWRIVSEHFLPGDTANKGTLRTEFHTLSMAKTRMNVSNYAAMVTVKAEQLEIVGEQVSDADKKNVFLDGLSKHFATIVTLLRNSNENFNQSHMKVMNFAKKENLQDVRDKGVPTLGGGSFFTRPSNHGQYKPMRSQQYRQGRKPPKANSFNGHRRSQNNGSSKVKGKCYNCGEAGHYASRCTKPQKRNHEQKYQSVGAAAHFMIRAVEPTEKEEPVEDDNDSIYEEEEQECSPEEVEEVEDQDPDDNLKWVDVRTVSIKATGNQREIIEVQKRLDLCEEEIGEAQDYVHDKVVGMKLMQEKHNCQLEKMQDRINTLEKQLHQMGELVVSQGKLIMEVEESRRPLQCMKRPHEEEKVLCDLSGCDKEVYKDNSGLQYDYCGITHARAGLLDINKSKRLKTILTMREDIETKSKEVETPSMEVANLINRSDTSQVLFQQQGQCQVNASGDFTREQWVLDSGSSFHLTPNEEDFKAGSLKSCNIKYRVGNNETVTASYMGTITRTSSTGRRIELHEVLWSPESPVRIMSEGRIIRVQHSIVKEAGCNQVKVVNQKNEIVLEGTMDETLLTEVVLIRRNILDHHKDSTNTEDPSEDEEKDQTYLSTMINKGDNKDKEHGEQVKSQVLMQIDHHEDLQQQLTEYHQRMGHIAFSRCRELLALPKAKSVAQDICEACIMAQLKRDKKPGLSENKSTAPMQLLHMDLTGTKSVKTQEGKVIALIVVDDYSRYTWVKLLKDRTEVLEAFMTLKKQLENEKAPRKVAAVRTDGAREFVVDRRFKDYLEKEGIVHQVSAPYAQWQNGTAERTVGELTRMMKAMMFQSGAPPSDWGYAIEWAAFLLNRIPSRTLQHQSRYELWHQTVLEFYPPASFGNLMWARVFVLRKGRMDPNAKKVVFLGVSQHAKTAVVRCLKTHKVQLTRDYKVVPGIFAYLNCKQPQPVQTTGETTNLQKGKIDQSEHQAISLDRNALWQTLGNLLPNHVDTGDNYSADQIHDHDRDETFGNDNDEPRRSGRETTPSQELLESIANLSMIPEKRARERERYTNPTCRRDAIESDEKENWLEAELAELNSIITIHNVYELVPRLKGMNVLGSRWVYNKKFHPDNTVDKWKARWVAKGFMQKFGVDYDSVFAPTGRIESVRILLCLASIYLLKISKFDIATFFLTGDIDKTLYVEQPEGYEQVPEGTQGSQDPKDYVCRLNKSLYGTKQAAALSNQQLTTNLLKCGFRQSKSETQVFIKGHLLSEHCIIVLLWIDDGMCLYKGDRFYEDTVVKLRQMYDMKFERSPKSFLSIQLEYSDSEIYIHQSGYTEQILSKFNMTDCNSVATPISKSQIQCVPSLETLMQEEGPEQFQGRTAIGMLGWLVQLTRPDLCYGFNWVCRHTQVANKSSQVFGVLKHMMRYLKGSKEVGITYPISKDDDQEKKEIEIKVLVDSDFAGATDKKSTSGYLIYINNRLVMYRTKKQTTVATSTCNAELNGIVEAAKATLWLRGLLATDLGLRVVTPTKIFNDNMPAIRLCLNPVSHTATRHFAIKQAVLREWVQQNHISILHMSGECLTADLLTKPLDRVRFSKLLPVLLQPTHDNAKTTKEFSSYITMVDVQRGREASEPPPFRSNELDDVHPELKKIIETAYNKRKSADTQKKFFTNGRVSIWISCKVHNCLLEFTVDSVEKKLLAMVCLRCLEEHKVKDNLQTEEEIAWHLGRGTNYVLLIRHTKPNHQQGSVIHVVGEGRVKDLSNKLVWEEIVLSCTTCAEYKKHHPEARSNKRSHHSICEQRGKLSFNQFAKKIKFICLSTTQKAETSVLLNGKFLTVGEESNFNSATKALQKAHETIKRRANNVKRSAHVAQIIEQQVNAIAKSKSTNEDKILKIWEMFEELKKHDTGLKESGLDTILLKELVVPTINCLKDQLTHKNKKAISKGMAIPMLPLYPSRPIRSNDSSASSSSSFDLTLDDDASACSSSNSSSYQSVSSSSSNSSSSNFRSRAIPPPLPPPLPPSPPQSPFQSLEDLVIRRIKDANPSELEEKEQSEVPEASMPSAPHSPLPGMHEEEEPSDELFYGLDSPLPNPF